MDTQELIVDERPKEAESGETEKNCAGNVYNVVNATVNNTNILTSTVACIDYFRKNKLALVLPTLILMVICVLLGASLKSAYNSSNTSEATAAQVKKQAQQIEGLSARIEEMSQTMDRLTSIQDRNDVTKKQNETIMSNGSDVQSELCRLKIVSGKSSQLVKKAANTLGDELADVILIDGRTEAYATFYLGKKYSKLSVNVSCPDNDSISPGEYPFEIYTDDNPEKNIVYDMNFGRNTAVTNIELDVADVDFITFRVRRASVLHDFCGVILSEGRLSKSSSDGILNSNGK